MSLSHLSDDLTHILADLFSRFKPNERSPRLFVLGCSTSTIIGEAIGQQTSLAIGQQIVQTTQAFLAERDIALAVQCCEHLNRALVVEATVAEQFNLPLVSVVPVLTAGGGVATAAYNLFDDPVVVEAIEADCGLDIGQTAIGMHIKHVQVPKHLTTKQLGHAPVFGLASRPKLIGGYRAHYDN